MVVVGFSQVYCVCAMGKDKCWALPVQEYEEEERERGWEAMRGSLTCTTTTITTTIWTCRLLKWVYVLVHLKASRYFRVLYPIHEI